MSFFEGAYAGTPPWDIGRPQPALVAAHEAGEIKGAVLDAGCGTGEHALYFAAHGHKATGIDGAPTAIAKAKAKAKKRGLAADFKVHDALKLGDLKQRFDAAVDSGLFHVFEDDERPRYVRGLHAVVRPGGSFHMLCFSDLEPAGWGPRRVTQAEIRAAFATGWRERYIRAATFEANIGSPKASLACFTRQ